MGVSAFKRETVMVINYSDFDKLVKDIYCFDYSFIDGVGCCVNPSVHEFHIESGEKIDKYYASDFKAWLAGGDGGININHLILIDMYDKGLINPGTFLIRVSF